MTEGASKVSRPQLRIGIITIVGVAGIAFALTPEDSVWHRYAVPAVMAVLAINWVFFLARVRTGMSIAFTTYSFLVVAGMLLRHTFDAPRWVLIVVTAGLATSFTTGWLFLVRDRRSKTKELDRVIFSEASSFAFFVTLGAAITYGFVSSWLELDHPSPWFFVGIGAGAFIAGRILQRRKYL